MRVVRHIQLSFQCDGGSTSPAITAQSCSAYGHSRSHARPSMQKPNNTDPIEDGGA